jgi:hypothetical protein
MNNDKLSKVMAIVEDEYNFAKFAADKALNDFYGAEGPDRPTAQFVLATKGRLAGMEDLWNRLNEIINID